MINDHFILNLGFETPLLEIFRNKNPKIVFTILPKPEFKIKRRFRKPKKSLKVISNENNED